MDQQTLRDLENKCIQEEPAGCVAACPIHLDARGFIQQIQNGNWNEAWKILRKTMPFPGILGRICDAPCRSQCKRNEAGGAIEIGALERACVSMPQPKLIIPPVPKKNKQVAVFGSGISSLTVCWDLVRKGYRITIFEAENSLGGQLKQLLPPEIIREETAVLTAMGVETKFDAPPFSMDISESRLQSFDAIYVGLDAEGIGNCGQGSLDIVPQLQTTRLDKVFAGGCSENSAASLIWQAAEGRWAATSIDRYLQRVSLTAGREKNGPYQTRLYCDIKGVAQKSAVGMSQPKSGYSESEAIEEARRCLLCECLECVKVCAYLKHFQAYPKRYVREIYNNESIVMGARQANRLINSCSLCGLCERVCPENFAMQDICLTARQSMVKRNKMPPSAHEFALMDMEFSQSEHFAMARYQPGKAAISHLFFPGCQLCASSPEKVFASYEYLCRNISGGVGLMLGCCSAPAFWAGREERFQNDLGILKQQWIEMGKPELILACSTCYRMFADHLPDIPLISLWQVFEEFGLPLSRASGQKQILAIHDPCTTRSLPEIQHTVRNLLRQSGVEIEELSLSKDLTECCGFGGLMQNANPQVARESIRRRAELSSADYISYCGMCRDNLASAGKRVLHVLDIVFPDPNNDDPAARNPPGWSERRENRAKLKDKFEQEIWGQKLSLSNEYENIVIRVSPQVRMILEQRRILDEDIRNVISHARNSGNIFFNETTGHYKASFKPRNVTFWVEYSQDENGFEIHNAYSHRMEVVRT